MPALPAHVLLHIATTTGIDHRTANRNIRNSTCPRCRRTTLRALDDDICAADVRADPIPLTPLGETLAHQQHIPTYLVHLTGQKLQLENRHTPTLPRPPGTDVIPEHRCNNTWPYRVTHTESQLPKPATHTTPTDPPF